MDVNFDLQRHLNDMESRIRADINSHKNAIERTKEDVEAAKLLLEGQNGRIKALEEKAGWIGAGAMAAIMSAFGFIWHIISGSK